MNSAESSKTDILSSQKIKKIARAYGADAVGIAPMDRFEGAPKELDPRYIYPEAKTMIGFIFRIPRGYLRGIEEGTNFYQYPAMGYAAINEDVAPFVLHNVGRLIEDYGYEAAVFRNSGGRGPVSDMDGQPGFKESPEDHKRSVKYSHPVRDGFPGPDILFQFRIAAYLCGLGEIGYSKMLLTPQFGPRNRQAFLFTDAELEPDPIYNGEQLCNRCMACVAACPGKCISAKETIKIKLAGHDVEWGKLNEWDCFAYYQGANGKSNPFLKEGAFDHLDGGQELFDGKKSITAKEFNSIASVIRDSYENPMSYNSPKCGGCLRACINSMEKQDNMSNRFNNRFRTGKPWKLNRNMKGH